MNADGATGEGAGRVAVFTADAGGGGAERAMLKLAGGLAAEGLAVDLVLTRARGHYLPEVPRGIRVVDLRAPRVLASLPGLVGYLRRERPWGMVTSLNHVNIVGIWARRLAGVSTALVANEQNTLSLETAHSPRRRHRLVPRLARRFYPWADAIVAVSQGAAEDLVRVVGIPGERVRVIPNPIVTPELRARAEEPLEHPWFGPDRPPVVLAVARCTPQKDLGTLVRAFALVRRERTARLLILGEGPERPVLRALADSLGVGADVDLPGWARNPYPYMRRAAAYVLSSRWEGLPSVLIEALFCGCPVIATDCPSGPREILEGGRHGALVPVGDAAALAGAIREALDGKIPRPTPASWEPYDQRTVARRYLEVLRTRGAVPERRSPWRP